MRLGNSAGRYRSAMTWSALLLLPALAVACKSATAPDSPPNGTGSGSMSLRHDSNAWTSDPVPGATGAIVPNPGTYILTGYRANYSGIVSVQLSLYNVRGAGTYPLGVTAPLSGGIATVSGTDSGWLTELSGSAGWVTITTLSADRIEGTFAFVADPIHLGATGPCTVTEGVFNFALDTGDVGTISDRDGGRISALVNGTRWNASTALVLSVVTAGDTVLILSAVNTRSTLALSAVLKGPGDYPLDDSRTLLRFTDAATGKVWGGSITIGPDNQAVLGDSGTVTFTSVTATRVQGRFSGRLAPNPPDGSPDLLLTDGEFDLGVVEAGSVESESHLTPASGPAS